MSTENIKAELFSEILKRLMLALKVDKEYEVAELLGFKKDTFSARKKRGALPVDKIQLLCAERLINFDWIMTGEGEISVAHEKCCGPRFRDSFHDELQVAVTLAIIELAAPEIDKQTAKNHASLCTEAMDILGRGSKIVPSMHYIKKVIKLLSMLYDFYDSDNDDVEKNRYVTDRITSKMEQLAATGKAKEKKEFEKLVEDLKKEFM